MEINIKLYPETELGTKRTITKFAWFPIKIKHNEVIIIKWLETVTIEQTYNIKYFNEWDRINGWINLRFVDKIAKN